MLERSSAHETSLFAPQQNIYMWFFHFILFSFFFIKKCFSLQRCYETEEKWKKKSGPTINNVRLGQPNTIPVNIIMIMMSSIVPLNRITREMVKETTIHRVRVYGVDEEYIVLQTNTCACNSKQNSMEIGRKSNATYYNQCVLVVSNDKTNIHSFIHSMMCVQTCLQHTRGERKRERESSLQILLECCIAVCTYILNSCVHTCACVCVHVVQQKRQNI